ncbi:hypothetical protein MES5069_450073 [Mesorhizobium escarrei]|uniref:Uncharacterized protein n=1 Tax=Mesorhizobium escarrei TaxID=666018 RepID=A0ABN8K937_9HYPH|nr:hypothetical protein MES5069_450073 [Mesorhizobium escarrei]
MALGPEDFSASVGGAAEFVGSIGEFSDTHKLRESATRARPGWLCRSLGDPPDTSGYIQ